MAAMSEGDEHPTRVLVGVYEGGLHHLTIPAPVVARANEALDEARRKREHEAEMQRLRVKQAARNQSRLKRALHAVLGRGKRR
jgi:hypothetical protein